VTIKNNQIESAPRVLDAVGSAPSTGAGKGAFYPKVVGSVVEAFYRDSNGNEVQITENGELLAPAGTGEANTGINVGSGEGQFYKTKTGVSLVFRTLKQGAGIILTQAANEVLIEASGGGGGGSSDSLSKNVRNDSGVTISSLRAVAFVGSGGVELADANVASLSDFAGITVVSIPSGQFGAVYKLGNVPGILSGTGANPGQPVYLGETPGGVTFNPPSGPSDTILLLGYAEPSAANPNLIEDLYLDPQIISNA
jgi:hypothetical protein